MRKEITQEEADIVANIDVNVGCLDLAIEKLASMGFDTSSFWEEVNELVEKENDLGSEKWIEARDRLFEKLNIQEAMQTAYNKIDY